MGDSAFPADDFEPPAAPQTSARWKRLKRINEGISGLCTMHCATPQEVTDAVRSMSAMRVGIDGIDGAGKSTLASELSSELGFPHISLDSFLEREQGGYVEHIDYPKLRAALEALQGFVVEGVCLRQVLGRIQVQPEVYIYIKRVQHGIWSDEAELDISEPVEVALAKAREMASLLSPAPVTDLGLAEEVIRYHAEFRPHNYAEVTYVVSAR